jgi:hypothetical protein
MTVQVKRACLDFVVRDYASNEPRITIVPETDGNAAGRPLVKWTKNKEFSLRCYMSLQGEDAPVASAEDHKASELPAEHAVYRYDWAFGITPVEGYYWDWMNAFPRNGALAIHLVLKPEPYEDTSEAIPVSAVLTTLRPSRNFRSFLEQILPTFLKGTAGMAKIGAQTLPPLDYLSSGLTLGSNVLESRSRGRKNWFLYQFLDEKLKSPVVEWRIYRKVLKEYGPLIRGSLYLAFPKPLKPNAGRLRILLRPQIHYYKDDEICYIIPTNKMQPENPVFIDVSPSYGVSAK